MMFLFTHHHPLRTIQGGPLPGQVLGVGRITSFVLVSGTLIHFVQRLLRQLQAETDERRRAHLRLEEERRFHAVATLAAGAAHEMGTPLSTIALVSRELELELEATGAEDADLVQMSRTIRQEVERCRAILERLRPLDTSGAREPFTLEELEGSLSASLGMEDRARVRFHWLPSRPFSCPRTPFARRWPIWCAMPCRRHLFPRLWKSQPPQRRGLSGLRCAIMVQVCPQACGTILGSPLSPPSRPAREWGWACISFACWRTRWGAISRPPRQMGEGSASFWSFR
nr:histidine kinase dimerization/phospho-acceptor domain-containing protein [Verrucomicrobium spinosum]